jgi:signal transduction histidine kinase
MSAVQQSGTHELRPDTLVALGDIIDAGVVVIDEALVIHGWNDWLKAASGLVPAQVLGRGLDDVFPDLRGSSAEALFRRALAGESVVASHRFHEYLLPLPAPVGFDQFERMQQSVRVVPARLHSGEPAAAAFIHDVTDRVAREDELRAARDEAEAASRAKSEFLAAVSHELRTPLTAVIGYADLLEYGIGGTLAEAQLDQVARIKLASWHLIGIIDEILTFSRAEAGREEVHRALVDIAEVARETMALVQPQATDKGLRLELELPPEVVTLVTDRGKLRQILLNLMGNAVKFTDTGMVSLTLSAANGAASFQVADTGPGIAPQDLERIFEPFTQLDQSPTRTQGGTGLGLPLSRTLANLLGGELTVSSERDSGTTFVLRLPLAPESAAQQPPEGGS